MLDLVQIVEYHFLTEQTFLALLETIPVQVRSMPWLTSTL
uniref:Uncharacterized protein n=1 Tax=Myoviridae sp. ct0jJ30 TaxID=2825014 RepID=A0A8S5PK11_9CAUD|nr:MAG TPA: hypothetical protein [Myoviridae sp. ct0jJ30]